MDDAEFLKELQEMTKSMQDEFEKESKKENGAPKQNNINNNNTNNNFNPFGNFNMPMNFTGNENDMLKELQNLINADLNIDDSDPNVKNMMDQLSKKFLKLDTQLKDLQGQLSNFKDFPNINLENDLNLNSFNNINNNSSVNNDLKTKSSNNNLNTIIKEDKSIVSNTLTDNNKTINSNSVINNLKHESKTEESSNPFVDAFNEMKKTPNNNNDIFGFLQNLGNLNSSTTQNGAGEFDNISGLYDILGKLSDEETNNLPEQDKSKYLASLFGNLLDYLLKSDMLEQPFTQIKTSVLKYIETNKEKMKKEELDKYELLLKYVETILTEIKKENPDKPLIIDIFYKLHEMSDFDSEIMGNLNFYLKDFSEMFGSNLNK